ncbi:MAG: GGDEF domain-containing phosphodiesterase [Clostridiales bacterium]|nr:GGDEF domain-containing phosphodiesterase [Clostridiales bacterium]
MKRRMQTMNPQIREYSIPEILQEMESLRKQDQQVRLVDAEECRTLTIDENRKIHYGMECHDVWNSRERCKNCTSYQAGLTKTIRYKTEIFQKKRFDITSVPVNLRLNNMEVIPCVMEIIRSFEITDEAQDTVTENREYYRTHDALTGLYNQSEAFRLIRKKLVEEPERDYLLIGTNIRDFHMVNILFGQETGNAILEGIANLMKENYADGGIFARIRSDRFILFIEKEKFHQEKMKESLAGLRKLISSPVFTLKIHIGVYEIRDADLPLSVMLQRTEIALTSIRASQETTIALYSEGLLERQAEDQWIICEFQNSLMTDQFRIYFQPQVDVTGRIHGAEALVRWIRNDRTMVPLDRFLPVLSRSDLITQMDEHVWEMAAMQLAAWKGTPLESLYISINVEPKDFQYINVPEKLAALCERYGVEIGKLHVEITESALADEDLLPEEVIQSLRNKGFTVEIDDFGKGSSCLSRLKDIPADVLKIDMGFLRESEQNVRSKIILESVVQMAERLNADVIVEGVETDRQKQELLDMGCRMFQGFLFSRPVPVEHFEKMYLKTLQNQSSES